MVLSIRSILKYGTRNKLCLRLNKLFCATFSTHLNDANIHVKSSLRTGKRSWEDVVKASEKLLQTTVDSRILETKLPRILLECIHAENIDSGPMADRLLTLAEEKGTLSAAIMHMVSFYSMMV